MKFGAGELHPGMFRGRYSTIYSPILGNDRQISYGGPHNADRVSVDVSTWATGYLYLVPIPMYRPTRILKYGLYMDWNAAGFYWKIGLYADNGHWYPGKLLHDSGNKQYQTYTYGNVEYVNCDVKVGGFKPVWGVFATQSSNCTTGTHQYWEELLMGYDGYGDIRGIRVTQAYGALPDPCPAGGSLIRPAPGIMIG